MSPLPPAFSLNGNTEIEFIESTESKIWKKL